MGDNRYTINQLVELLGISRTAVVRKIDKYKFDTVQEYVDGVLKKVITITDEQIETLKNEVKKYKGDNTVSQHSVETFLNNDTSETVEKTEINNQMLDTVLSQFRYYADTALTAEREKTHLIEDKARSNEDTANFYKGEVSRLTQEYNTVITQHNKKTRNIVIIFSLTVIFFVVVASVLTALLVIANNKPPKIEKVETVKVIEKVVPKVVVKKK